MEQLTREQAVALFESGSWQQWTPAERALFQVQQDCLCMPFAEFHKAMEQTLGRPVWTHEFGLNRKGLTDELLGLADAPSFEQIVALIPADKLVIVDVRDQ